MRSVTCCPLEQKVVNVVSTGNAEMSSLLIKQTSGELESIRQLVSAGNDPQA